MLLGVEVIIDTGAAQGGDQGLVDEDRRQLPVYLLAAGAWLAAFPNHLILGRHRRSGSTIGPRDLCSSKGAVGARRPAGY